MSNMSREPNVKIKDLNDINHSLLVLIERLQGFSGSKELQHELADVISQRIDEFDTGIESLALLLEDQSANAGKHHRVALEKLREDLAGSKIKFRKAQVASKKNQQQQWKLERELLFGDRKETDSKNDTKNLTKDELIMSKSDDITNTLRQVHRMAQAEVAKSELNIEELEYSTKSLKELEKRYSAFDVLLSGSQLLVRHLEEADKWDRIYMLASLGFLVLVLAWIVWRRILKGPVKLFLWTTFKLFKVFSWLGSSSEQTPLVPTGSHVGSLSQTVSDIIQQATATATGTALEIISETTDLVESAVESAAETIETISTLIHDDL